MFKNGGSSMSILANLFRWFGLSEEESMTENEAENEAENELGKFMDDFIVVMDKDPSLMEAKKVILELKKEIINSPTYRKLCLTDTMLALRLLGRGKSDDKLLFKMLASEE